MPCVRVFVDGCAILLRFAIVFRVFTVAMVPCMHTHRLTSVAILAFPPIVKIRTPMHNGADRKGDDAGHGPWRIRGPCAKTTARQHCPNYHKSARAASPGERFLHSTISWHSFLRFCVAVVQRVPLTLIGPTLAPAPLVLSRLLCMWSYRFCESAKVGKRELL